jgi:uncharacterized cupredoxin-like copper-binding protein
MIFRKIFFLLFPVVLLAACSASSVSQPATELTVEASDFAYSPATITIPAGQPVTLTLQNRGAVEHDFVVDTIQVTDVEASDTGPAAHHQMDEPEYDLHFFARAGESAALKFTAMEPGTYEIFCTIEGHKQAGMIGTLIVSEIED